MTNDNQDDDGLFNNKGIVKSIDVTGAGPDSAMVECHLDDGSEKGFTFVLAYPDPIPEAFAAMTSLIVGAWQLGVPLHVWYECESEQDFNLAHRVAIGEFER